MWGYLSWEGEGDGLLKGRGWSSLEALEREEEVGGFGTGAGVIGVVTGMEGDRGVGEIGPWEVGWLEVGVGWGGIEGEIGVGEGLTEDIWGRGEFEISGGLEGDFGSEGSAEVCWS